MKNLSILLLLCLLSTSIAPACWAKRKVYIAVGDSYAFGYTTSGQDNPQDPNAIFAPLPNGAPGYVAAYARALDPRSGTNKNGLEVVNLGIPGETSATFFTGGSPGAVLNQNYPLAEVSPAPGVTYLTNAVGQYQMLVDLLDSAEQNNRTIHRVTIHLGANDMQVLLGNPAYLFGDQQTRASMVADALEPVADTLEVLLTTLQQKAPKARVFVLGYPDPFPVLDQHPTVFPLPPIPGLTYQNLTGPFLALNDRLAAVSAEFGVTYVDVQSHFVGHMEDLTYILDPRGSAGPLAGPIPNGHPSVHGYGLIDDLIIAQEKRFKD